MVISSRGSQGGYRLARDPERITAAQILDVFEGPIAITDAAVPRANAVSSVCAASGAPGSGSMPRFAALWKT